MMHMTQEQQRRVDALQRERSELVARLGGIASQGSRQPRVDQGQDVGLGSGQV